MQHFGKAALRATKNYTKGYSDTQAKVRDATSNDPWGPTGQQMNEIAKLSWNQQDFIEIIEILDKRLNDKGKNWRHVFKTLAVIDYCLLQGSEDVVKYYKTNMYMIKTLREFQYIDEDGTDQGANVRQRAKDITNLLLDDSKIRTQRRGRADASARMRQGSTNAFDGDENRSRRKRNKEDEDLQRAIEESKRSSNQDQPTAEDRDLQRAIELSKEDEANRSKSVEDANASALFDDQNQLAAPNQTPQFSNNPFPMPMDQQFMQLQPQFTMQPQFTGFNPYQQQMQEAAQAEFLRQQEAFQQQQAAMQAQQQQEEWMRQQMMMQQQQQQQLQQQQFQQQQSLFPQQTQGLIPQPTGFGANNPFAQMSSPTPSSPQLSNNNSNNNGFQFNIQGTYESGKHLQTQDLSTAASAYRTPSPSASPQPQQNANRPIQVKLKQNENQELANLFADREGGQDTFGNTGILRYGHTDAGRLLASQQTGKNPFALQQQQGNEQPFFSV